MNAESLEVQILSYLRSIKETQYLSPEHPEYTVAKEIETLFTSSVDFLRANFPNPTIRRLAAVMWDVIEQKIAPVCLGPPVPTLSFAVIKNGEALQAMIIAPANWHEMMRKDPLTQVGALVCVGSQAIDYANDRFTEDPENVPIRATAYEAEYLNTVKSLSPNWAMNKYQEGIIHKCPEGVASPKARRILYSAKPLITA